MTTLNLHCTQKLRDKLKAEPVLPVPTDHWLGTWYATVLMWRPQLVLLVPDGHPKLLHVWPVKLLQAGRGDYGDSVVVAMRDAASFSR